jgi:TatD DNase family protein
MLVDSHCHLDFDRFDGDRDAVIQDAIESGVGCIINPGFDLASCGRAVLLAEQYNEIYAAVGIHPHQARTVTKETITELRRMAAHPKVVAIGEIGLDYYRDLSPREAQRQAFGWQLDLACDLNLPVIVHCRSSSSEVMTILEGHEGGWPATGRDRSSGVPGVMHSYSGDRDMADRAMGLGLYLGISGPVTFSNAEDLRSVVSSLPPERLLVETDAPFLTPHPFRGRRNEPKHVRLVANAVASLQGREPTQVERETSANASRLFGLTSVIEV